MDIPKSGSQTPREQIWRSARPATSAGRFDLLRLVWLRQLLITRWPQFLARAVILAGFVFTILAGLFGSPVGSHNFAIIFVWIAWWTALKLVFIPLGGRSWCSVCPIPMPGEWLQNGSLFERAGERKGLNLSWPKRLRGSWLQSGGFLLIGLISALTLTDPRLTAWILLVLFLAATALSLVFERRAFCSYLCPIGGFTGMYSQTAPIELRVKDTGICRTHSQKTCYANCPWGVYPVVLKNNAACGLCMECVRSCPKDNIALSLRAFETDIGSPRPARRLDEAFLALVMLGSVIAFSAVFLGPWGALKTAAFSIGSLAWLIYSLGFLALTIGVLPGLFTLAVWMGQKYAHRTNRSLRQAVANYAQALLPLGLFAWIAFTVSFAFPKLANLLSVLSDPLGWGWNLFGSGGSTWNVDVTWFSPPLQLLLLLVGLFWCASVARKLSGDGQTSRPDYREAIPVLIFSLSFSAVMSWLLVG